MSGLTGFVLSLDGSVLKLYIYKLCGFKNIQIRVNVPVKVHKIYI